MWRYRLTRKTLSMQRLNRRDPHKNDDERTGRNAPDRATQQVERNKKQCSDVLRSYIEEQPIFRA
jgi:hypothetical protein